ncbi:putative CDP-alcohol phosphatidyltransferase family protein [Desulfamplus magnetovallimortis]|uniref:Putative CDP-alcohol phosphatidyltransferase family protein n=1 Tax=Desulfamplus magnetovallimortis TaxID=1246637 RepID=A0A1W1HAT4_9BACT|nr:CDP-alcohol phosphatidyltransferase family protein [Desulfamplus magnetovallimortis]SLM29488.1 putative CDP-alcohol phosphatidyltransferase family protein [Desulfamplus magnetovallimortis]
MTRFFPVFKHVNIPNLVTSLAVVLALACQAIIMKGHIETALTLFMFVLLLNRIDGVLARKLNQVSPFGKELGSLSELLNFVITPIVLSWFMGFDGGYSLLFFSLFLLAGIWRLADFNLHGMVQKGGRSYFRGLCCTHAAALFVIVASLYTRFFEAESELSIHTGSLNVEPALSMNAGAFQIEPTWVFIPFYILTSLWMVSSFQYDKNGKFTLSFYLLTPISVFLMFL